MPTYIHIYLISIQAIDIQLLMHPLTRAGFNKTQIRFFVRIGGIGFWTSEDVRFKPQNTT